MKNDLLQSTRTMLVLVIVTILLSFAVQNAVASQSTTVSKAGFLTGITAKGRMRSFPGQQPGLGICDVRSYTQPTTTINKIGWTWWQCDRLVNGNFLDSQHRGPAAITGSDVSQIINWNGAFTGSVNGLRAHGVHDFNHTGSQPSPWQPYNVNTFP